MVNKLKNQTSPYLLQHAENPVDWYPWGDEALTKARNENKPIFLSIGYAACHWCHVMAHESFENDDTANYMNEHFVNIKVDREERPDIDAIYMQATVAMTGSGGWPMSVFLTPELKPFYTGTYFPPTRRFNLPSFRDVLSGLANAWMQNRGDIENTGVKVSEYLQSQSKTQANTLLTPQHLDDVAKAIHESYDWGYGGWGDAPKFPQAMAVEFLLHHDAANKTNNNLKLVTHCLKAMARGGMYDVVGGGFSRYSTDNHWKIPHFEKMAYDNALLIRAYLHAWQVTKDTFFKNIVEETLEFISREMTHKKGGFYSSLDADSEGIEGKFYVWSLDEIREILGNDSGLFEAAYGITQQGNWEGHTILQRALDDASLAARFKIDPLSVSTELAKSHSSLLSARASRIRPGTDDKILTSWNGLMLRALAESARVLENVSPKAAEYLNLAQRNAGFILSELRPNGRLVRAWRDGKTTKEVFLEDYASLILGLLELYQTDFNNNWFVHAKELADEMIDRFRDSQGGFFDTPKDAEQLLIRPKDIQDNATPSGNSLACEALVKLAAYTNEAIYRELAEESLNQITEISLRYPLGFANWLSAAENALGRLKQVAVLGEPGDESFKAMLKAISTEYRPSVVLAASSSPINLNAPALLQGREIINGNATAFVCEGFVCKLPTTDVDLMKEQLL